MTRARRAPVPRRHRAPASALAGVLLWILPARATPCSCESPDLAFDAALDADAVFAGRVESVDTLPVAIGARGDVLPHHRAPAADSDGHRRARSGGEVRRPAHPDVRRRGATRACRDRAGLEATDLVVQDLLRRLQDAAPGTRAFAVATLGELGCDAAAAVPELRALLVDPDADVRYAVARALDAIGPEP